jgi:asparagine synthase (glutamine-hydrolysing)
VKVALSGECADEIFGGYPWFRDPEVLGSQGFPWAQNTKFRASLLHPDIRLDAEDFVQSLYEASIAEADILPENSQPERQMKQMVYLNYRWFMQTLLDRKDRMSMYHSVEVRVPFCDHRIAEYLYAVPWEFKDYRGVEKSLLRYAMDGWLPKEVLWRKKSPYPKTWDPKYRTLVSAKLQALLDKKDAPVFQILSQNAVRTLLEKELTWPWYGQLMGTPQTMAYILQMNVWMEHYMVQIR